jgi:DNA-directed RNA polymerase subunit alpha
VLKLTGAEKKTMKVRRDTAGEIRAGDIVTDPAITIANADHLIATLTSNAPFECEMTVEGGRGYATVADNRAAEQELGVIPIDSIYSPVLRVRYRVEDMRVGQRTNYDRLILEIWTKGTVTPQDALVEAGMILRKHLNPFVMYHEMGHTVVHEGRLAPKMLSAEDAAQNELLERPVSSLNLSARASNCLDAARVTTLRDLVTKTEADLLRVRSFGKTSLHEVQRKLSDVGLSLGMRLGPTAQPKPDDHLSEHGSLTPDRESSSPAGPMEVFTMED